MNFWIARDKVVLLETAANLWASWRYANGFFEVFFLALSWEVQYITKHFMTGPAGKNEFCFPSTSMLLLASPQETMRVSGKQNSLAVSLGASHKVLNVLRVVWGTANSNCTSGLSRLHTLVYWFVLLGQVYKRANSFPLIFLLIRHKRKGNCSEWSLCTCFGYITGKKT